MATTASCAAAATSTMLTTAAPRIGTTTRLTTVTTTAVFGWFCRLLSSQLGRIADIEQMFALFLNISGQIRGLGRRAVVLVAV